MQPAYLLLSVVSIKTVNRPVYTDANQTVYGLHPFSVHQIILVERLPHPLYQLLDANANTASEF